MSLNLTPYDHVVDQVVHRRPVPTTPSGRVERCTRMQFYPHLWMYWYAYWTSDYSEYKNLIFRRKFLGYLL